jgi:hypothetical protein
MANAVRSVTATHAHSATESVVHSATARSATANADLLVTATAVHARLHVTVSVVNGLLAETVATSVRVMTAVMTAVTTVAHVTVLAPKSVRVAAPLASVQALQPAANTVAAMLRVTASAVTA